MSLGCRPSLIQQGALELTPWSQVIDATVLASSQFGLVVPRRSDEASGMGSNEAVVVR